MKALLALTQLPDAAAARELLLADAGAAGIHAKGPQPARELQGNFPIAEVAPGHD